ncbi:MAG: ATP-binding protein [Pyrinomonadaceae bacterium]
MLIRPKVFLTCLALCLFPLLLLAGFNYWSGRRAAHASVRRDLEGELTQFMANADHIIVQQEDELLRLTRSDALRDALIPRALQNRLGIMSAKSAGLPDDETKLPLDLRVRLAAILNARNHFAGVACFDQNTREVFLAERGPEGLVVREADFLPGQLQPDERVWKASLWEPMRSPVSRNSLRSGLKISVPVIGAGTGAPIGVVVGEIELDSLLRAAVGVEKPTASSDGENQIIVLDDSGTILYHPNQALLHQPVNTSLPHMAPLTQQMLAWKSGWQVFAARGKEVAASYAPVQEVKLFAAVIDEHPQELASLHRAGVLGLVLAAGLGCVAAFLLARFWERRPSGIDRVTRGVAAIAGGDLNHRIEAHSSDAIRPLSDDLNLMTAQLREQIARKTEARQFQSFIRLSAMLTHDLKNAIEALSLIVSNMERHFDNEAFRADAMKSLNLATRNLRSLVDRLTNPVNTLSGEYKRPRPLDLVPLFNRVVSLTAAQASGTHQIETKLPASLVALADETRIQKVMENLVLNGLEAMTGKAGKLTIEAGQAEPGKVFFSVSDTGAGMSPAFVENQLYRPFATTKKRGVGLGLYTCREFVRANGGTIEVDSREGAGTTFRVVLPSATIERAD